MQDFRLPRGHAREFRAEGSNGYRRMGKDRGSLYANSPRGEWGQSLQKRVVRKE